MDLDPMPQRRAGRSSTRSGLTHALASFIARLRREAIPASVQEHLRNALVDAVGCGLIGLTNPCAGLMQAYAIEQGGPEEATVWSAGGRKVAAVNAALAAGTAVHASGCDDCSRADVHPGSVVVPAALALGEREHVAGACLLIALAVGYETMVRVALAANPAAARIRGWDLTATAGSLGAAAAASVILGLDADSTANALGLAGAQSGGLRIQAADGSMSRHIHSGRAAQTGIMAGLLAARAAQGPRYVLEAEHGGILNAISDDPRAAEVTRDLGVTWRAVDVWFRSCRFHESDAALDAARLGGGERDPAIRAPDDLASAEGVDAKFLALASRAMGLQAAGELLVRLRQAYVMEDIALLAEALAASPAPQPPPTPVRRGHF